MEEIRLFLDSVKKVKEFVKVISKYEGEFSFISGRYIIDARSMIGIFSLDLSQPVTLIMRNVVNLEELNQELEIWKY